MFSTIQSKIILGLCIAFAIVLLSSGGYFWWSQDKIGTLHDKNGKLEAAVTVQTETIKSLTDTFQKQATEIKILQIKNNQAETQYKELAAKLRSYDLANTARINRDEAEKTINSETDAALKELEAITGGNSVTSEPKNDNTQPLPKPPVRDKK